MKKRLLLLLFFMMSAFSYAQDLVVVNTDNNAYYIPGTTSTYTITVINMGPGVATGVAINNAVPAGIEYFSWTGSNGSSGIYDPLVNTIGTLNPGQMVTYIVEMEIPAGLTGPLSSEAIVTSASIDPFPACPACIDTNQKAFGADIEVINTDNQTQYVPGSTVTYTTTVVNNGPLTAANIQFDLALPAGITTYTWSGTNSSGANNIPVSNLIPSLLPGESVAYTTTFVVPAGFTGNLTTTASATTPTFDPVPGCTQCVDTDTQGSGADLTTTLTDGQTFYTDPGTNTYTLTITNNGPAVATDVHVVNPVPAGVPAANYDWFSNVSTTGAGVGIDEVIPSIAVGQTVTYTITLTVPAGLTADIVNQVSVTSTSTDPTPACDACSDTDTYTFGADLVVTNSDGNITYVPGSNNVYTVTVTNLGPNDATGVVVSNLIPAGITAFSWVGTNGTNGTDVPLADNVGTIPAGTSVTYTITLGVPAGFTGPLTSNVNVTATSTDPNPGCTTCSDTDTQALTGADINVTKTDGSIGFTPGTIRSYTITIVNNGPQDAQGVVVNDPVPANIPATNVSWTGPNGNGTGAVSENLGTLTVGQVVTYTVNVVVPADYPQDQDLVNTVDVTSTTPDPNPDCFRCTDVDQPFPMADLVTFKTDGKTKFVNSFPTEDPENPEMWTYVITVTNLGPSVATDVSVSDPLPLGISLMEWSGNGTSGSGALNDIIPVLQVGEVVTYQVSINIPENYSNTHTNLVNTVIVDSVTPDPDPTCPNCVDDDTADNTFVTVEPNWFTLEELVEDVLIHSDCANVSNFTKQDVTSPGANNANSCIGYFKKNNSTFPLKDGVIIGTARVEGFEGHYNGGNGGNGSNQDDDDLQYISDTTGGTQDIYDAAFIQFDFVPGTNEFSFKFLFTSEEYGIFQCNYGDVFAFLLTDLDEPIVPGTNPVNIATIPDVLPLTPVKVTTVRDEAYNGGCESVNPDWYGQHNSALPVAITPVNVIGQCLPMIAKATVIPGHNYRIKLAIADYQDNGVNSAVFLEAGSFNVGQTDIAGAGYDIDDFPNLTGDAAACLGDTRTLEAGASAVPGATYAWYLNDLLIPGETDFTLVVDEPGVYTVNVSINGGCQQTDDITVEFRPENVLLGNPDTLEECGGTSFNLTLINPEILNGQSAGSYGIQFHHSAEEAVYLIDPIIDFTAYNGTDGEIIYASVEDQSGAAPCISVRPFTLVELDCGDPTDPADLFECDDDGVADGSTDFDISGIPAEVLGSNIAANYTITIHETLPDAENDGPSIPATTYTGSNGQTLYVRFENNNDPTDFEVVDFVLNVGTVPTGTVSFDVAEACVGAASPQATFTIVGGTPPYDIVINTGGADIPMTITSNTAVVPVDTVIPGTITATLVSVTDNTTSCTSLPGTSATVVINEIPDATITASATSICEGEAGITVTLTATGGTAPYTFAFENGGVPDSVTSASGVEIITFPNTPGTYTLHLSSVSDVNCSRDKDETITVIVYALPEATVVSDVTELCEGSGAFQLTFTGSNGEAPYTFDYQIGTESGTAETLPGQDSVTVAFDAITAGTHDIQILSVSDAHCTQSQNDLITVTVNTLPEATITSNVAGICQDSTPMTVTFTGSNGTAPYTFNYTQNGVAASTTSANPTISIDTSVSGPVTIVLVSVSDVNCTNPQDDILELNVWTLPTATITVSATQACQNSDEPVVTLTASSGTSPYTFNFEVDGAADSFTTVGTETQHTISIPTAAIGPVTVQLISISDANGCIQQINQTVSVTVVAPPVIPAFPVLHVCDDNNDGIGCFDLTSTITAITGGNPNLTLTFHETMDDAQNQVNPITGTTYCNPNPATQTIYVSLINTGAPDCASTAALQLFVDPVPVAPSNIPDYALCDYTLPGDGQEQFDLSTMDDIVANGQTGLTITYYLTEDDANDEVNAIGPVYASSGDTIWVRLEFATGCSDVASFELVVNPLPAITPYGPVTLCSDGVSDTASFPIAEYSPYISGGIPGTAVSYHLTQGEADTGDNPLPSPYVTGDTVIYVRLEDVDTDCATTTTLTLQVEEGPAINPTPTPLERCDPNNDGFEIFDLTLATTDILGGIIPGLTISYHETPDDAQNNVNPIVGPYTNIEQWGQDVYVRVTSDATGCPSFTTLHLIVKPTPEANEDADPLQECDPDGDGEAFFDLASSIPNILDGLDAAGHTVRFWPTEADYLAGTNEIVGIDAYLSASTIIYVSVDSTLTECSDLVELELIVNPLPVVPFPVETITQCDTVTPDDQTEVFDLTMRIPAIVGSQTGLEVTFYRNEADALAHTNPIDTPEAYSNEVPAVQTIWITVTNVATTCESVTTMDIRVEPLPSPILPALDDPRINLCDGNQDGISEFDLDALIADMQQGDTNITITFHPTEDDAENGVNPLLSPYTNDDAFVDTIWVRAVNSTTLCSRVVSITLNVTPAPVIPTVTPGPLEVCDTLGNPQDGLALFDLTVYEADILAAQTGSGTYTIEYYTSLAAAQDGLLPIINPTQYQGVSGEIWYRIVGSVNDCSNIGSFLIQVNAPVNLPVSIGQWSQCDTDPVGPAIATEPFDLTDLPAAVALPALPAGAVVTFYANQADFLAGANAIPAADLSAYVNVANAQTIYISVTNAEGCTSHTTLTLKVLPLPTVVALTDDQYLHMCDTDATVGTEIFDLTQNEEFMAGNDPNLAFSYYLTQGDAETATSPIADPTAHTSATASVWVRIEKLPTLDVDGAHCYVVLELKLFVDELPQVATPTDTLTGCAATGSVTAVFDLTGLNDQILVAPQDPADFTFAYYSDAAATLPIGNFTSYTGTDLQVVYVVVSNVASDCSSTIVPITLDVQEAALATQPTTPATECATSADGTTHVFDLTTLDAEILGGQDAVQFTIAYYAELADAQANANAIADPANFDTATTTVYAVVTNSLSNPASPCRSDIIAINLTVEPLLQVAITGSEILCVTYPDLTPIAPGTLLEISGIPDPTQYVYEWYLEGVALGVNAPQYYAQAPGNYTAEVMSLTPQGCVSATAVHTLILSSPPVALNPAYTVTDAFQDTQTITINVQGVNLADYQYSLDGGPLQSSPVFTNVGMGNHSVRVVGYCDEIIINDVFIIDYPHYFTPNGDGIHDTWNISWPTAQASPKIYIFDRYGKLLKQIHAPGDGWDGTFNGHMMPSNDYWFNVIYTENGVEKEFKAHFALKR